MWTQATKCAYTYYIPSYPTVIKKYTLNNDITHLFSNFSPFSPYGGEIFRYFGVYLSLSDVVMSLLRLTEASDCIQHPHWMYRKCFSILICYEQAYVSTLTLVCLCRLGEDFWEVDLSPCDVVMSWLRLKPPMEYILHP